MTAFDEHNTGAKALVYSGRSLAISKVRLAVLEAATCAQWVFDGKAYISADDVLSLLEQLDREE